MANRAHRAVLRRLGITHKKETWAHFAHKTLPCLPYVRRMGGTFGSSTFIALMGLIATDEELRTGDRIGVFSYGSGSCSELWSGKIGVDAKSAVRAAGLPELLDARRIVSVAEYEAVEKARSAAVDSGEFATDLDLLPQWYENYYRGKGLLIFKGMEQYYRQYAWS